MKILTWNCNGALRKKLDELASFDADIIIVQECENPETVNDSQYKEWARNFIWTGKNNHKGLGIFARENVRIKKLRWNADGLKYFIACKVNDDFNLLGTWCHSTSGTGFSYIGQLWKYLEIHKMKLNKCVIAGDFNSNVIWDRKNRCWNHSEVVKELRQLKIESLYLKNYENETEGKETRPTFFLHRNLGKPYHIDYIFASEEFVKSLKSFSIGLPDKWIEKSDHMPLCCEV